MGYYWLSHMRCNCPIFEGAINYQRLPTAPPDSFPSPSTKGPHTIHSVAAEPECSAEDRIKLSTGTSKTGKGCSIGEIKCTLDQQEFYGTAVSSHIVIDEASSHYSINDAVLNVILREYPRYLWCLYLTDHLSNHLSNHYLHDKLK